MPKNAYLSTVRQQKQTAYTDGIWDGINMGLNLCAIANNRVHGHGDARLTRTEAYVQKLIDELIDTNDPLVNKVHIEEAVKQIRGKNWKG